MKSRQLRFAGVLIACALPGALYPLAQYLAVAPFGARWVLWLTPLPLLAVAVALPTVALSLVIVFIGRARPMGVRMLVASVVVIAAAFVGMQLGRPIRPRAFRALAERSAPLVDAIRAYESAYSRPPPALDALVPEFLPSVPGTGMAAYPTYRYRVGAEAASLGNPWVLIVSTPSGLNFDQFMYFPLQNYSEQIHGDIVVPIADWAYVAE